MDFLNFNSVETLLGYEARAAFTVNSASVFKEGVDIVQTIVDDTLSYIPWGGDNQKPFDLLALVEKDETLATCQCFNAEVCYGSGCNIAPPNPPQRSRMMSRTSFLTMTSPLIFSASVRTLSTSASPSVCLFSTRTAQRLCAC